MGTDNKKQKPAEQRTSVFIEVDLLKQANVYCEMHDRMTFKEFINQAIREKLTR